MSSCDRSLPLLVVRLREDLPASANDSENGLEDEGGVCDLAPTKLFTSFRYPLTSAISSLEGTRAMAWCEARARSRCAAHPPTHVRRPSSLTTRSWSAASSPCSAGVSSSSSSVEPYCSSRYERPRLKKGCRRREGAVFCETAAWCSRKEAGNILIMS